VSYFLCRCHAASRVLPHCATRAQWGNTRISASDSFKVFPLRDKGADIRLFEKQLSTSFECFNAFVLASARHLRADKFHMQHVGICSNMSVTQGDAIGILSTIAVEVACRHHVGCVVDSVLSLDDRSPLDTRRECWAALGERALSLAFCRASV